MLCRYATAVLAFSLPTLAQTPDLLVSSYSDDTVYLIDPDTGAISSSLGSIPGAQQIAYGPDGCLYIASEKTNQILRFDGTSGAPLGMFVGDDPLTPGDESGGLTAPTGVTFGPDGFLYVGSFDGDSVLRYDGTSGAFDGVFVQPGDGNLNGPDAGMQFGPDGLLWVPSFNNNRVLRYDRTTGAYVGLHAKPGSGLRNPRSVLIRSDGLVYISSWGTGEILSYDLDGNLIGLFATVPLPTGLAFEPGTGHVLVTSDNGDFVRRFDGVSGAALPDVVAPGGTLASATFLAWLPDQNLHISRLDPGTPGVNSLAIRGAAPNSSVLLLAGTTPISILVGACAPVWLGVVPEIALTLPTDAFGNAAAAETLGPGAVGITFYLSAYDPADCRLSNLVVQTIK